MTIKPVFVTQPHLPPLAEFIPYLEKIWANKTLTNGGPFHVQLEQALCDYLGVKYISLFVNGTVALQTALQVFGLKGEVITTPFSFIATSHAISMNGLTPVFVDIDPKSLNLDPTKIEAAITSRTSAILPVHCYGNPCDVVEIEKIAHRNGLKVIYDAAHSFGVCDEGGSILRHGDLSVLSFHATKVFNTFEGGAIVSSNYETKQHIDRIKNFGYIDELMITEVGTNGKMSEVNAAFGILQLKHIDEALVRRANLSQRYSDLLQDVVGIRVVNIDNIKVHNYSYFPILVDQEYPLTRDQLFYRLKDSGFFARRYFYPLISDFPHYQMLNSSSSLNLRIAKKIANEVICLPIFPALDFSIVDDIVAIIREAN